MISWRLCQAFAIKHTVCQKNLWTENKKMSNLIFIHVDKILSKKNSFGVDFTFENVFNSSSRSKCNSYTYWATHYSNSICSDWHKSLEYINKCLRTIIIEEVALILTPKVNISHRVEVEASLIRRNLYSTRCSSYPCFFMAQRHGLY